MSVKRDRSEAILLDNGLPEDEKFGQYPHHHHTIDCPQ